MENVRFTCFGGFMARAVDSLVMLAFVSGCAKMTNEPATVPIKPAGTQLSFRQDVQPIFNAYGCPSCHGGTAGLTIGTRANLLIGGDHGPAIIPGNADSSILIKKLSTTPPFGVRMPLGGPYLSDATVNEIKAWINQGAPDN
jgi:hypothetical protein